MSWRKTWHIKSLTLTSRGSKCSQAGNVMTSSIITCGLKQLQAPPAECQSLINLIFDFEHSVSFNGSCPHIRLLAQVQSPHCASLMSSATRHWPEAAIRINISSIWHQWSRVKHQCPSVRRRSMAVKEGKCPSLSRVCEFYWKATSSARDAAWLSTGTFEPSCAEWRFHKKQSTQTHMCILNMCLSVCMFL